ncbi:uncharacterized protein EV420DRAFT_1748663 [Desarmillaria tabescens]|uniref:Uncharacterized protein n=1 Tax=Armillaria tabescens TaxID=1929756 RepID=A0AA39N459_ARMTA|nr:uncharacterized protein EV420DRAFT_1748663 [Desarmillaria tabescens]KAK0457516.1 hypothetical protein EV420DRAFT_1748663 [Desarmillaria tabescens]
MVNRVGIFLAYGIYNTEKFSFTSDSGVPIYAFLSTNVAEDFMIAFMMCYYMHKSGEAINSSTFSYKCFAWPESFIFLGIEFVLPKLYINLLLAMSKKAIEEHGGHSVPTILQLAPNGSEGSMADSTAYSKMISTDTLLTVVGRSTFALVQPPSITSSWLHLESHPLRSPLLPDLLRLMRIPPKSLIGGPTFHL